MKKLLWRVAASFLLVSILSPLAQAQVLPELNPNGSRLNDDTTHVQLELLPDTLVAAPTIDSLKIRWAHTPPELRDLVGDRISCFETDVPHLFNGTVMSFVEYFTNRNRAYTQRILEREHLYFPLFETYLAKYKLPQDLKYLAVVESALVPQARSRVGAVGLWQFMGPTASDLRLRRDEYIDERMNPEKSTEAACKYLRDLYRMFGDWELVMAAYNYGSGNIMKAIRKAGGQRNFWAIYPYLPKETRNYVPTFTAAMYAIKYSHEHGLHTETMRYLYPEPMDTLVVSGRSLDLRKFSAQFGLDSAEIQRQNPEIRKPFLPESIRNYALKVPACVRSEMVVFDRSTLLDFCKVSVPPPAPIAPRLPWMTDFNSVQTGVAVTDKPRPESDKPRYRRVRHTVKRGETVAAVAERYDVTPAQILRWNELRRGKALVPRQQLLVLLPIREAEAPRTAVASARKIYVPAKLPLPTAKPSVAMAAAPVAEKQEAETSAGRNTESFGNEPVIIKTTASAKPSNKAPKEIAKSVEVAEADTDTAAATDDTLPKSYVVRKGDILTKIAREHGVTVAQIMAWNKLETEKVAPGQHLTFYAASSDEETAIAQVSEVTPRRTTHAKVASATPKKPAPAAPPVIRKVHLVQPGDTLYNISRRYQGVTVEQLRKLNNLKSDNVKPGQKLVIVQG
ncbi:LysM peptidoglycan-binding domain-containing protein [Hymenobacter sp. BT491]|uniref:LysM peptidoglycan-binding domain-containing protein n=1 Tax=Hymenobacter sp. BT491 TaxID=2766779 RepID=UPI0016539F8D|nr:lytic transglycosylase domain-containing protein [Hymenobacter sp. BT491]MBC6990997.1 LysM peptidoglycan-binding domain-containing protein [Hymenobacter sp. BT491]